MKRINCHDSPWTPRSSRGKVVKEVASQKAVQESVVTTLNGLLKQNNS